MLTIGMFLLAAFVVIRYSVKSALRKADEDLFLAEVLNKTATAQTGLYYTSTTSGAGLNTYCGVATVVGYLALVIGAFCLGGGLIMLGR